MLAKACSSEAEVACSTTTLARCSAVPCEATVTPPSLAASARSLPSGFVLACLRACVLACVCARARVRASGRTPWRCFCFHAALFPPFDSLLSGPAKCLAPSRPPPPQHPYVCAVLLRCAAADAAADTCACACFGVCGDVCSRVCLCSPSKSGIRTQSNPKQARRRRRKVFEICRWYARGEDGGEGQKESYQRRAAWFRRPRSC